mgnify:CR=1 FL=1
MDSQRGRSTTRTHMTGSESWRIEEYIAQHGMTPEERYYLIHKKKIDADRLEKQKQLERARKEREKEIHKEIHKIVFSGSSISKYWDLGRLNMELSDIYKELWEI